MFLQEEEEEGDIRTVKPENHLLTLRIPDPDCFRSTSHGHALGLEASFLCICWIGGLDRRHDGSAVLRQLPSIDANQKKKKKSSSLRLSNSHTLQQFPHHRKLDMFRNRFRTRRSTEWGQDESIKAEEY